jgi:putative ABC transport system ATP-binding protein
MIELSNINHVYSGKFTLFTALYNVNIKIPESNFVILLGQSGSGKTTLLNIIAGLMKPTSGTVIHNGQNIYNLSNKELTEFRKDNIGFVFQNYFLENNFTALENVLIPLFLNKKLSIEELYLRAKNVLALVGLEEKIDNKPTQLSGGECQRVAIARALVNNPQVLIADEPTGNLDSKNGDSIVELLRSQVDNKRTVIMVTHNPKYIQDSDIVFEIEDGKI